jgi:MFS family permease
VLFVSATFLYWVALYLYVPTLPAYVATKTANLAAVGSVLAMYGLWQALVRIPVGISVDAVGRGKPFIIGGFAFAAAGALVIGLGDSIAAMTLGRSLTGFAAATWVPLIAVFSGLFPPEKAVVATSLITFSASLARMIATSLNGALNNVGGYPLAFILAAVAAGVAAILIGATPLERQKRIGVSGKDVGRLFARPDVIVPSVISLIAQIGNWSVTFGFLPILAERLGGGDVAKSLLVALNLMALTGANLANTYVSRVLRRAQLLSVTIFVFCAAIVLLSVATELWFLFAAAFLMGLANGFTYPTLMGMSIEHVEQGRRSTAMGIHQSVYAIGMFVGPWVGGILAEAYGIRRMFVVVAVFIVVVNYALLVAFVKLVRRSPRSS